MYCKLFASLYQGTLRGRAHEILVFTNLLAHCDSRGIVDKHFRAIAEEVGLSIEETKVAIQALESPDPESRSPEAEGARIQRLDEHRLWGWKIVNYTKYRNIKNEDDRREQNRIAQEKWRGKRKQASSSISNSKQASANVITRNQKSAQEEAEAEVEAEAKEREKVSSSVTSLPTSRAREAKATSEQVVIDFCLELGLQKSDGSFFWNHWQGNGWINGKQPIKDWKATIRSWKSAGYVPSQKASGQVQRVNGANGSEQPTKRWQDMTEEEIMRQVKG